MKTRRSIRIAVAIAICFGGIVGQVFARENINTSQHRAALKATASGCQPGATSGIDMDINNVRALLMTGGDMWWNIGEGVAAYEIPIGSGKSSQFAASCWIGGFDQQGQLKVAGQTYRQSGNDYWPGALNTNGKIAADTCVLWDHQWKVQKSTINKFIQNYKIGASNAGAEYFTINTWPAAGNTNPKPGYGAIGSDGTTHLYLNPNFTYASFADLNGNGIYEPLKGEYPVLESNGVKSIPDELIWWVFNDAGNVKQMSLTASIGVEVQTSAFGYATQDFLNNSTFCNYRVINRGALTMDSTYIAVWDDCDLGWYYDDYIGCDTSRGLGIQYNGNNDDGQGGGFPVNSYGKNPPQVGLDYFQGPKRSINVTLPSGKDTVEIQTLKMTNFTYYNNDGSIIGNPNNGIQMYGYMTGTIIDGEHFSYDYQGPGVPSKGYGSGPDVNFVFWGDAGNHSGWSECACNNNPGDRRFIFSAGPFKLLPGAINDITFGCIWAPQPVGGCPVTNFAEIESIDDGAQALFDSHFKTVEGPQAPRMVCRELDGKLIFYLVNDYGSNNYGENYGNAKGTYADSLQYHQPVTKAAGKADSLYQFEGYEVFQLANSSVTPGSIFNQTTGEVDPTQASLVFQCDIHNGVSQIVNYVQDLSVSDTTEVPQIKVVGKDSGIIHSFQITQDAFATTANTSLINYHTYYYVAIAYAYNNFAQFNPLSPTNTQDAPYLPSSHGAGGIAIPIVSAMPNPANGAMGTVINSEFGSGVIITRLEGMGNGGKLVQLTDSSEATAVYNNQVNNAVYQDNAGPIDVKVVDPTLVPSYNWVLQIDSSSTDTTGIVSAGTWRLTALSANNTVEDVIYSEQSIGSMNEQILEKYGLSISIGQVRKPGYDQVNGNGYITSDITFTNPSQPWLAGVADQSDSSFANWLRSGGNKSFTHAAPCNFNDCGLDVNSFYENMFANFTPTKSTWGPYALAAGYYNGGGSPNSGGATSATGGAVCGFEVAALGLYYNRVIDSILVNFHNISDVDLVFTSDITKWTRCAVVEQQEDSMLSQGKASKFFLRRHAGWNMDIDANGNPVYSESASDNGMSWFPGYAVDQLTGKRLNIVFGEDSYLGSDNGNDMLWNPSSNVTSPYSGSIIYGGKHVVYILGSQYDSDKAFVSNIMKVNINTINANSISDSSMLKAYQPAEWVGIPTLNPTQSLLPLSQHLIPTTTRLRFRVTRPYAPYQAVNTSSVGAVSVSTLTPTNPYYTFTTSNLAPTPLNDNTNKNTLLNEIYAVPNPYYGYSGYEQNRFDTKVRIINLPAQVNISIYTLDGSLIRTLTKNDATTSYIDWDIRNSAGLPIASGMYLIDVKAYGIGETVIKWFGATRPIDVTTY